MTARAWVVVAVYGSILMALGLFASRRRAAAVDYFLASRQSRWPTIGLSIFAANISSIALVGLTGGAYGSGLSVFDYEWSATVILVFFCLFFLPSIIKSGIYTMPQYLERRYDPSARLLFALLTLFLNVAVDLAGVLYSGSLICRLLVPDWPPLLIIGLLAGAAALYTIMGGLRSVMYTEVLQAVVLVVSASFIAVTACARAGGWHEVMHAVPPASLSLIRPASDPAVPWPGLLLGIPILGFYYWCTNQNIVQCTLTARSIEHARWGTLFAGLLKLSVLFLVVLPGICALLLFPHLPRADMVYAHLILNLLPDALVGLVVAAFIAATLVGTASLLNSASTLITMDVVRRFRPDLGDRRSIRMGRIATACLMLFAVAWAPQLYRFSSLWQYLQGVLAYVVPPIVVVFLLGKFWEGANAQGAKVTLWLGSLCGLAFFLINGVWQVTHVHFLFVAPLLAALDGLIMVAVSVVRPAELSAGQKIAMGFVGDASAPTARLSWWLDYRIQGALLIGLTAALVVVFH